MNQSGVCSTSFRIEQLTYGQVQECISRNAALIVPLGGCEPLGNIAGLGAEALICSRLAEALSFRLHILITPVVPFGCSVPFMSFPGVSGVKPATFINFMQDLLRCYIFQGVKRLVLINAVPFNLEPLKEALKRVKRTYAQVKTSVFDINSDTRVRGYTGIKLSGSDYDRNDSHLLSLISYLAPEMLSDASDTPVVNAGSVGEYRTWRKRGRDPQKYRTLFPQGLMSAEGLTYGPEQGRALFELMVDAVEIDAKAILEL